MKHNQLRAEFRKASEDLSFFCRNHYKKKYVDDVITAEFRALWDQFYRAFENCLQNNINYSDIEIDTGLSGDDFEKLKNWEHRMLDKIKPSWQPPNYN